MIIIHKAMTKAGYSLYSLCNTRSYYLMDCDDWDKVNCQKCLKSKKVWGNNEKKTQLEKRQARLSR